ncbi:hypothetical protein BHM03_00043008 [Ensete ventricosum]|nr:hypothetical protein BHM03_00043008 [Ensete ventricosum]
MKLQLDNGPRSSLGIRLSLDNAVGPRREFARRFAERIGKLAGNMTGDCRKKTRRLTVRIQEAARLAGYQSLRLEIKARRNGKDTVGEGSGHEDDVESLKLQL